MFDFISDLERNSGIKINKKNHVNNHSLLVNQAVS